jgi:hypothetical protein
MHASVGITSSDTNPQAGQARLQIVIKESATLPLPFERSMDNQRSQSP